MKRRQSRILMVIVALLCAGPAMAGDERALHAIVAGGNAFDLTTTLALRNRSTVFETNPTMRHATVPVKGSATAVEMYMVHRLWLRGQRRAATIAAIGVLAGNSIIGIHNLRVTR
jgi:hypothetical protein